VNAPHNSISTSQADNQRQTGQVVEGVSILGFMLGSAAKRAGMQVHDVIIEYDGARNLSADKLASLTQIAMARENRPRVVFVRDGHEHSLRLSGGPLGISVVDTTIQGPLGNPPAASASLTKNRFRSLCNTDSILQILRNTDQPVRSYLWRAWLIVFVPTVAIGTIGTALGIPGPEVPLPGKLAFFAVAAILIAPWAETLLMWPILWILKRFIQSPLWVASASAVVWGMLHGLNAVGHGLTATWMFLVFSLCFLEWEKKSKLTAIGVTALLHMCQNSVAVSAIVLSVVLGVELPEEKAAPPPAPPSQTKETPPRPVSPKFQFGLVESSQPKAAHPDANNNMAAEFPEEEVAAPSPPPRQTEERPARPEKPKFQWGLIESPQN
jgi:hypothetical protein